MDPRGVTGATPDLMDLTNSLLDAADVFMDPGGILGASMVLVDPGGITPDLMDLSTGLLDTAVVFKDVLYLHFISRVYEFCAEPSFTINVCNEQNILYTNQNEWITCQYVFLFWSD